MKTKTNILDVLASLISIGAGIYLLTHNSASGGTSWFQVIAHGIGAYFIAKGLWMARSLYLQAEQRDRMDQLLQQSKPRQVERASSEGE